MNKKLRESKEFKKEVEDILKDDSQRHDFPFSVLKDKIDQLSISMEKMKLAEYVELLNNPSRLLYINFLGGVARGVGMAIGFTILGALVLFMLQKLLVLNLPVVGGLIAELVKIVQNQLQVTP